MSVISIPSYLEFVKYSPCQAGSSFLFDHLLIIFSAALLVPSLGSTIANLPPPFCPRSSNIKRLAKSIGPGLGRFFALCPALQRAEGDAPALPQAGAGTGQGGRCKMPVVTK